MSDNNAPNTTKTTAGRSADSAANGDISTTAATEVMTTLPGQRHRQTKYYGLATIAVVSIVILAGIVLVMVRIISSSNHSATSVLQPTERPTKSETETPPSDLDDQYFMEQIVQRSISNQNQFDDETTPQYLAITSIVQDVSALESIRDFPISDILNRYALAVLYYSTNGTEWDDNGGYLTNDPVCSWYGIQCDSADSVIRLDLQGNNLNGNLPAELAAITSLEEIFLGENELRGTIPPALGSLSRLASLELDYNLLSGPIPDSFAQLSNLKRLDLDVNDLTGTIPPGVTRLPSLRFLNMGNNLLSGDIPTFNQQTFLRFISFDSTPVNGSLPESIFMLPNLEELYLVFTNLTGTISSHIGQMKHLKRLHLYANFLSGTIPSTIGNLESAKTVLVDRNNLSGSIPTEVGRLSRLERFNLYDNLVTGTLPSEMGQLESLEKLALHMNPINGIVPSTFSLLSKLERFTLQHTNISGSLDSIFCNQLHTVWTLEADCGGTSPEVTCSCCSRCCNERGHCETPSFVKSCQDFARDLENKVLQNLASCTCASDYSSVSCDLSACPTCNEDSSVCGVTIEFIYYFGEDSGFPGLWVSTFQYETGKLPANVTWEYGVDGWCGVRINGRYCDCSFIPCDDGFNATFIDCTRTLYDGDGPLVYNGCFPEQGGVLDVFEWMDEGSWTGCPFVPMEYF